MAAEELSAGASSNPINDHNGSPAGCDAGVNQNSTQTLSNNISSDKMSVTRLAQKTKPGSTCCSLSECVNPVARVIGDCRWCSEKFCLKHRLPEAHSCQNISGCRAEASNGLAKRLLREKCISNKV